MSFNLTQNIKNKILKSIAFFSFISLGFFSSLIYEKINSYLSQKNSTTTLLHSLTTSPKSDNNKDNQSHLKKVVFKAKMGKHQSVINVQLEKANSDEQSNLSTLRGYITLLKSFNQTVIYNWSLPDDVQIVEGSLQGQVEIQTTESPAVVEIKVAGFNKDTKKVISLTANTVIDDLTFGNVGLLSSTPEESLEYLATQNFNEKSESIDLSSTVKNDRPIAE